MSDAYDISYRYYVSYKPVRHMPQTLKRQKDPSELMQRSRIRKILVPVDRSQCSINAVEFALDLAARYESGIYLVHIIPFTWRYCLTTDEEGLIPPYVMKDAIKEMKINGERLLSSVFTTVKQAGIEAHAQLEHGRPANKIVQIAERESFDLIVMGSSGRGAIARLFFGSVSDEVTHKAPCPVLIVKESQEKNKME